MQPSLPVIDEPLSASMDGRGVNSNSSRKSSINMSALSSHEQKQSSPQLRDNSSFKSNETGPAINSKSSSRSNSNASSSHERPILNGADNLSYKMDVEDNNGISLSPHEEMGEER